jgi:hypothetical protein
MDNAEILLKHAFGEEPRSIGRHEAPAWWAEANLRNYEREVEDFQTIKKMFTTETTLREMILELPTGEQAVVLLRFGLIDGNRLSSETTAKYRGISTGVVWKSEQRGVSKLRRIAFTAVALRRPLSEQEVETLGLSERVRSPIRRARIDTVQELILKSGDWLLGLTNFGVISLREVRYKLALRGLTLPDEPNTAEQVIEELQDFFEI